ncbi:MAG: barstar family protein [Deltaproteobacteria bacterium]|nr:barstar family protein [Deltaproteobacteria bacterium]
MPVEVKRCFISGEEVQSLEQFYDAIGSQLSLPEYFGHNLDALWDVLSTDVEGPVEIVWTQAGLSRQAMKEDFERLVAVLEEVVAERDDISLEVQL